MSKIISFLVFLTLIPGAAVAQITPDSSLGAENSVVESSGNRDTINGGAIRDANLFHSFQEFNVEVGKEAYFANPDGIANIFSRVTGKNISDIQGVLGVLGNANLFFLNPNGIIFGENASLDVGGSFVASTASAIQFGDRGWFSATDPEQPPLLTVQPSAFFFNQIKAGRIENRSTAPAGVDLLGQSLSGLRVPDGKSLLLLGGDIAIDGGELKALGGRVELAGVAGDGTIGLNIDGNDLSLSVPEELARADIYLDNRADVNARAGGGGSIVVNARNLNLAGVSRIRTGISSRLGSVDSKAGDIEINITGVTNLTNGSFISNSIVSGTGNAGDINITTKSLSLSNDAFIASSNRRGNGDAGNLMITAYDTVSVTSGSFLASNTFRIGNAGHITINAGNLVFFDGVSSVSGPEGIFVDSGVYSNVQSRAQGNSGEINITTGSLFVTNGAGIFANIFGIGKANNININARDTVSFDGVDTDGEPSGAFSGIVEQGSEGQSADINIMTGSLFVTNGAELIASTGGQGDAGSVNINARDTVSFNNGRIFSVVEESAVGNSSGINITTNSLSVTNDALLNASTLGEGEAGSITVTANTLEVSNGGRLLTTTSGNFNAGNITLEVQDNITLAGANSGLFANTTEVSKGKGGGIFIDPRTIAIQDGAQIAVDSQGSGEGGEISLIADSFTLDNQASISAETASNNGGDITLKVRDLILLRNGSEISTTAGIDREAGDGGNITLETPLLVAFPQENSDIKADAFEGKGGNINIDAQNILGFQLQEDPNLSDITASSQFGLDGTVNINTSGIEIGQESIELPIEIVDISKLIDRNLCSADREGEFIVTGKGGLSPSPKDTLNADAGWEDWRVLENSSSNYQQSSQRQSIQEVNDRAPNQIVEAQSWFRASNGNIVLTAQPVKSVSRSSPFVPLNCQLLDELPK